MRRIDHIAYAVPNLDDGIKHLQELLGCEVIVGGRHLNNGTHNALVNLGNEIYLELIATDIENKDVEGPRWMAVDLVEEPRVTRWALKSNDLNADLNALKVFNPDLGNSFEGSRKKQDGSLLKWHMALPLPAPEIELAPFAVDWKDSIHPTRSLTAECELISIELIHPNPTIYAQLFAALDIELMIYQGVSTKIKLEINSPKGIIEIA